MIYLDTSALLKLVYEESESSSLVSWLAARPDGAMVTSEITSVELVRACRRVDAQAVPAARALLSGVDIVPLTGDVVEAAAEVGDPALRTLDALHLASALAVAAGLSAFVAYDHRLCTAAAAAGLAVSRPAG